MSFWYLAQQIAWSGLIILCAAAALILFLEWHNK